jgi:hypothetical protein
VLGATLYKFNDKLDTNVGPPHMKYEIIIDST